MGTEVDSGSGVSPPSGATGSSSVVGGWSICVANGSSDCGRAKATTAATAVNVRKWFMNFIVTGVVMCSHGNLSR